MQTTVPEKNISVHEVLARSYMSYLLFGALGLVLDLIMPWKLSLAGLLPLAIFCLVVGPVIIFWAQASSRRFARLRTTGAPLRKEFFCIGPYRFLRNPTHLGLMLLIMGYAMASASLALFLASFIATLVSNWYFRKHEAVLEGVYGAPYREYRASVPTIM